jgi:hypothetical protein
VAGGEAAREILVVDTGGSDQRCVAEGWMPHRWPGASRAQTGRRLWGLTFLAPSAVLGLAFAGLRATRRGCLDGVPG